jgi:amino acid adenylation domain-containing protein
VTGAGATVPVPLPISDAEARRAVACALRRTGDVHGSARVDLSATVLAHVRRHAGTAPSRVAVLDTGRTVSYRQLVNAVATVRRLLLDNGCHAGEVVAATGPRGAHTVVVFLALESIGAGYLPVDPEWPAARLRGVLLRSRAGRLVTYGNAPATAAAEVGLPVLALGPDPGWDGEMSGADRARCDDAAEPRYVIYTSGTTGTPKGAVVEHRGMLNHLWAKVHDLSLTNEDTVAFSAPLVFDIAIWQMLAPLLVGGAVAVVPDADMGFPRRLLATLRRGGVTVVELVPTVVGWLADEVRRGRDPGALPALRWLISTGEELPPAVAGRVLDTLPHVLLLNAYGPTECSDDVTHHVVRRADIGGTRVPVGAPIEGVTLYVLVADGTAWRAARPGDSGELFVGGVAVGAGYLDDPTATAAAFFGDVLDPASATGRLYRTGDAAVVRDGLVYCLGRLDRQVKVSGVRIELDEVEAALHRHPAVARCAVLVDRHGAEPELVAHYVANGPPPSAAALREFLLELVPPAMAPERWVAVEALPLTPNGKTDYQALARTGRRASQEG